jgi:riboflavin synthase
MFTGIIETTSRIIGVASGPMFRRLTTASLWDDVRLGESIAVNGCCLTVAEMPPGELGFDVIAETLAKTNLGSLAEGDEVHLERAMRIGDRIDGHFVQGHIDGTARLVEYRNDGKEFRLSVEAPRDLAKYLAPKGSVTIDGVSLTIAALNDNIFEVALIPTTLARTSLGKRPIGWAFNLETDILSKTVVAWLERQGMTGRQGDKVTR